MNESYWSIFKSHFIHVINNNPYYLKYFVFLQIIQRNVLFYGQYGFPTDLFIDEILKVKFNIDHIYRQECIWNKDFVYQYNQHFLEIDLMHPSISKNICLLSKFIIDIIKNKNIANNKHFFIIKHIDILSPKDAIVFRIVLEKYSNNVFFFCTTHKLDKIETPIKSRFSMMRMPLLSHQEVLKIFKDILKIPLNVFLAENKTRNIVHAIFIAELEKSEKSETSENSETLTKEFCTLFFPPIHDFLIEFNKKKNNLDAIRQFSYKCFQFNISIPVLTLDLLKLLPKKYRMNIIHQSCLLDHSLQLTNKGREPVYIETFLCNVLL